MKQLIYCMLFLSGLWASPLYAKNMQDAALEYGAKIRLILKRNLPTSKLSVQANHDILQVAGFVDNNDQLRNLLSLLDQYRDKHYVIQHVKVLASEVGKRSEQEVEENIIKYLNELYYPTQDIAVQVRNGEVILSGFLTSGVDLDEIGYIVETVPGVRHVNNFLMSKQA